MYAPMCCFVMVFTTIVAVPYDLTRAVPLPSEGRGQRAFGFMLFGNDGSPGIIGCAYETIFQV